MPLFVPNQNDRPRNVTPLPAEPEPPGDSNCNTLRCKTRKDNVSVGRVIRDGAVC